jgi:hypothetical protein
MSFSVPYIDGSVNTQWGSLVDDDILIIEGLQLYTLLLSSSMAISLNPGQGPSADTYLVVEQLMPDGSWSTLEEITVPAGTDTSTGTITSQPSTTWGPLLPNGLRVRIVGPCNGMGSSAAPGGIACQYSFQYPLGQPGPGAPYLLLAAEDGIHCAQITTSDGTMLTVTQGTLETVLSTEPVNVSPPVAAMLSGSLAAVTVGDWQWTPAPVSYSFQWQNSPDEGTWTDIPSATVSGYLVQESDGALYLRCVVTQTVLGQSTSALSNSVGPVPTLPVNLIAPVLTAPSLSVADAEPCNVTDGMWAHMGFAESYVFTWQNSPDGVTWTDIAGAGANTYQPQSTDIGLYLQCVVEQFIDMDSASATSNTVGPITA